MHLNPVRSPRRQIVHAPKSGAHPSLHHVQRRACRNSCERMFESHSVETVNKIYFSYLQVVIFQFSNWCIHKWCFLVIGEFFRICRQKFIFMFCWLDVPTMQHKLCYIIDTTFKFVDCWVSRTSERLERSIFFIIDRRAFLFSSWDVRKDL